MKLYAISDLHLGYEANQRALSGITSYPADWLILAGDVGETAAHLELAFRELKPRFAKLVWVPGNHELWTLPSSDEKARGRFKYDELVELCRSYGVLTPEDPYPIVTIGGREVRIAPLFILYDYSFRPLHIPIDRAVDWAREEGIECADEVLLHPDPYADLAEWCHARCEITEQRLKTYRNDLPTVLINHFPLREISQSFQEYRASQSGAGHAAPKIGTSASMRLLSCRDISISVRRRTAMVFGLRKSRLDIRGSGPA